MRSGEPTESAMSGLGSCANGRAAVDSSAGGGGPSGGCCALAGLVERLQQQQTLVDALGGVVTQAGKRLVQFVEPRLQWRQLQR